MISREAGDKQKGFRLQKIRAITLMLDLVNKEVNPHIYGATEYYEDVYVNNLTSGSEKEVFEEDKNYDPSTTFSFNNPTLRNSIVSFIDIWIGKGLGISEKIYFTFYATNKIVKERNSTWTKDLDITLPEKAILEKIANYEFDDDVMEAVIKYMVKEYKCQYDGKSTNGYIDVVKGWSKENWKKFLKKIDWLFGQQDEKELKDEAIKKISDCKYFSNQHCSGSEEQIFSSLMELFDSRQDVKDPLERFVHAGEIEAVFLNVKIQYMSNGNQPDKKNDPVWEMWETLPEPTDKRVLSEKILEVCPNFTQRAIENLAKKVTRNYLETQDMKRDKDFLSYRYRIYEKCTDDLLEVLKTHGSSASVTEEVVQSWMKTLNESAYGIIQDLSSDFYYRHNNKVMVEGVILELFDTCFLSFDYA